MGAWRSSVLIQSQERLRVPVSEMHAPGKWIKGCDGGMLFADEPRAAPVYGQGPLCRGGVRAPAADSGGRNADDGP
jgi:hypothetical protein